MPREIRGGTTLRNTPSISEHNTTRVQAVAGLNARVVKPFPGALYNGNFANTTATTKYIKFYDSASAPVVGTDTPLMTIPIPANNSVQIGGKAKPDRFRKGICYAITGGAADGDTTAVAAGDVTGWITIT